MRGPSRIPLCQAVSLFQFLLAIFWKQTGIWFCCQQSGSWSLFWRLCVNCFHANSVSGCKRNWEWENISGASSDQGTFCLDWTHEICVGCSMLQSCSVLNTQTGLLKIQGGQLVFEDSFALEKPLYDMSRARSDNKMVLIKKNSCSNAKLKSHFAHPHPVICRMWFQAMEKKVTKMTRAWNSYNNKFAFKWLHFVC